MSAALAELATPILNNILASFHTCMRSRNRKRTPVAVGREQLLFQVSKHVRTSVSEVRTAYTDSLQLKAANATLHKRSSYQYIRHTRLASIHRQACRTR